MRQVLLTPYYQMFVLEKNEMLLLAKSREMDASVKLKRTIVRRLAVAEQHLNEVGAFDTLKTPP